MVWWSWRLWCTAGGGAVKKLVTAELEAARDRVSREEEDDEDSSTGERSMTSVSAAVKELERGEVL